MNENFWSQRYQDEHTQWDIGYISPPIKKYIDQLEDKDLNILIPGAGNSYEAEYLYNNGYRNVHVCDIVVDPLKNLKKRSPEFPENQILKCDYFKLEKKFDLIIEQTFFCAIPVIKRQDYARQASRLLNNNGKIVGLFFDFELTENGPPFGGSKQEYLTYFSPYFEVDILERCYNSIPPRQGNELFFKFRKK